MHNTALKLTRILRHKKHNTNVYLEVASDDLSIHSNGLSLCILFLYFYIIRQY